MNEVLLPNGCARAQTGEVRRVAIGQTIAYGSIRIRIDTERSTGADQVLVLEHVWAGGELVRRNCPVLLIGAAGAEPRRQVPVVAGDVRALPVSVALHGSGYPQSVCYRFARVSEIFELAEGATA